MVSARNCGFSITEAAAIKEGVLETSRIFVLQQSFSSPSAVVEANEEKIPGLAS
jgi:hypothetical protein